jgi:uncharacterized protein YcfL
MIRCFVVLTTFAVLMAPGCASTHPARVEGRIDPFQEKGRVQWNSTNLKSVLRVDNATADRTESGLLRVRLILRNKTRKDIVVDVRTLFTDKQGFEKEQTNWEPIVCTARTQTQYEAVSLGPHVDDYQVIIREPRKFEWNP